ncbi:hypothetical protein Ahy_B07g087766 [Arachis hypogaea]|uniref:Uncharacterized protein n=1 Tax=Arachis hypogaea TaxID=3818 RepID=A0A444YCW4_ARAHY|nr:hypothetical protein Ahy_B07g087766 [Arachis hypogaea]
MKPLVESDPSIKVKSIIVEVHARFNYTISCRKAWLAKQKSIAKVFGGWEESYQALPLWFLAMVQKMPGSQVQIETRPLYNGSQEVDGVRILHRVERLPCRHVIACYANHRLDWQVYVNDVYNK